MLRRAVLVALLSATFGFMPVSTAQPASQATFELYVEEVYDQLAGGAVVFSVTFRDPLTRSVNPALRVEEGQPVAIKIVNRTNKTRSFAIMSVAGTKSTPIRAGASGVIRFKAPPVGNYIYNDPLQSGNGETRTLFGDFVVKPRKR